MVTYLVQTLEKIEPFVEVLNVVLALAIVFIGTYIFKLLTGKLRQAWKYYLGAMLLFGIHEIFGAFKEFKIFEVTGMYAITEMIFITAFLISTVKFRKLFSTLAKKNEK